MVYSLFPNPGQTTLSTLPVNSVFQHPISNGVHSDISSSIPSVSFSSGTASLNPTSDSSSPLTASYLPGIEALAKQVSEMSQTLQFQRVTNELQGELLKLHRDLQSKTDQFLLLDQRNRNLEEQLRETQIMLAREQGLRRQLELTNTTLKRENVYLHEENEELHLQLYEERVIIHRMQKEQRIQSQMKWASHFGIEVATPV